MNHTHPDSWNEHVEEKIIEVVEACHKLIVLECNDPAKRDEFRQDQRKEVQDILKGLESMFSANKMPPEIEELRTRVDRFVANRSPML